MSDLTTYRTDDTCSHTQIRWLNDASGKGSQCRQCGGTLTFVVPDTRLQAIADAWKQVHATALGETAFSDPAKTLHALLDALTQEDNDEVCSCPSKVLAELGHLDDCPLSTYNKE